LKVPGYFLRLIVQLSVGKLQLLVQPLPQVPQNAAALLYTLMIYRRPACMSSYSNCSSIDCEHF